MMNRQTLFGLSSAWRMKTPIMIDMQQLNAKPAAVQAVLRIVPHTDLHTSGYEFSLSF
jgi:hypothetical protein